MSNTERRDAIRDAIFEMTKPFEISDVIRITKERKIFDADTIFSVLSDLSDSGMLVHIDSLFYLKRDWCDEKTLARI